MLPKRAYAKINLDNIKKNIEALEARLPKNCDILGIVKADSYGHGSITVAKFLEEMGVTRLGVASVGEAVELRENGIGSAILVLGEIFKENMATAIQYDVDCTVADLETAKVISQVAVDTGKTANIHLKIDTGMGRIGFQANDESLEIVEAIFNLEGIKVRGIFTHFACADSKDKAPAENQRAKFLAFTDKLENKGYTFKKHFCNSAAAMELEGYCGDFVRAGIMMYGLYPSDEMDKGFVLSPAMELKSSISFLKEVSAGFTVSYGSTYTTTAQTKIATVPVGYADGYPRYLSNKGEVLIGGTRCKILGRICMDQFMVDVTHLEDVKVGDEVTLLGIDGNENITVEELSHPEYRFNYEFCCLINKRVPRIYVKDGKIIE